MLECGNAGFDPLLKSGGQNCCDAQHGFFSTVVECDPRPEVRWRRGEILPRWAETLDLTYDH